ncbi:MAG: carboxypeptidase regulatory-like domain-containing protein, partial [Thermoplasmata archaeon]|nr:carboxypeptidase regulatory-like domain-containing protein [Thermoplasmata archaeon]
YNVTIDASDIVDLLGNHMVNDKTWTFTTRSAEPTETGSIEGSVVDENGDPVIGATVTIEGYSTTTDANGDYSFTDVPVGDYTVRVEKSGYETTTTTATVLADQTTTVPPLELPLKVGLPDWIWIPLLLVLLIVIGLIVFMVARRSKKKREMEERERADLEEEAAMTEAAPPGSETPPPPPPT